MIFDSDSTMPPSLENLASTKIAIELWSHPDVKEEIIRFCVSNVLWWKVWDGIQKRVEAKVSSLYLPKIHKCELILTVKQIGLHIQMWIRQYKYLFVCSETSTRAFVNELCWTSKGTINNKKTVEVLLDRGTLGLKDEYTFACVFCLTARISIIWQHLSLE